MPKAKSKDDIPASQRITNYIDNLTDWRGEKLARIREIFHEVDPDIVEEWKWMGSPVWSHDGIVAVGNAHKKKVKLVFDKGVHIPDPHKIFNAMLDGNKWRAIDILEGDEINETSLKELIQSAISYNVASKEKK